MYDVSTLLQLLHVFQHGVVRPIEEIISYAQSLGLLTLPALSSAASNSNLVLASHMPGHVEATGREDCVGILFL